MAIILLSDLIDFIVSSIQKIKQKKISFYYDKTMVNFCLGCDVHMFFCWINYRGCVIYSKKNGQK